MAVHDDTGNRHLHVAVNRVNPDTLKAVSPFRDYLILDRAMREVELAQGWSHDRGPYAVADGRIRLDFKEQSHGAGLDAPASVSQKARDFEAWMGSEPFTIYVRRIAEPLRELLKGDEVTWAEFTPSLRALGRSLRSRERACSSSMQTIPHVRQSVPGGAFLKPGSARSATWSI